LLIKFIKKNKINIEINKTKKVLTKEKTFEIRTSSPEKEVNQSQ